MYIKIKTRIFEIIEKGKKGDKASKIFDIFLLSLISLNIITVFIETFDIGDQVQNVLNIIELFSVIIFTLEYLLRVWTSDLMYPSLPKYKARLKYIFSFMALIDFLAIVPFYLPFTKALNLTVLRALRLLRLFRLFKVNRYTNALRKVITVVKNKAAELVTSLFIVFILMIIASVLMYAVEGPVQPEVFANGFSGFWWAVATFTTVGYGDIYPITIIGKIIGTFMSLLGIGFVAIPTGIISSGFMELHDLKKENKKNISDLENELTKLEKQLEIVKKIIENTKDNENK